MINAIQELRSEFQDSANEASSRVAIELNTSCPNIKGKPPPAYDFPSLLPLLNVLAESWENDQTLTIGLKLPPYVYATQFTDVVAHLASFIRGGKSPFAFVTCTNTLGSSLLFGSQTSGTDLGFALPTPLGGLAGEAIHSLALGNVYSFTHLLAEHAEPALHGVAVIGVGGVTSPGAVERMRRAGARVVGAATILGREGIDGFRMLLGERA
jgi:dihydroorotate dehydrogenase (fumarate)